MNILYHHRTQGKHVEGVHIREVVKSLRDSGHTVDIVSPPGVDPFATEQSSGSGGTGGTKTLWRLISRFSPQILFDSTIKDFWLFRSSRYG